MAILQSVMQKISGKTAPAPALLGQQAQALTRKIDHLAPLYGLQQERKLLDVICQRTGVRFQSLILAIDLDNNWLELDELFPFAGAGIHWPGDQFTVQYHRGGEILSFAVALVRVASGTTPLYYFTLPDTIETLQRRKNLRIGLSKQHPLAVKLLSPMGERWHSTAQNLSAGGMRLVVGGNLVDQLQRDTLLRSCEFSFNDDFQVRCEAQVKSFRFNRKPFRQTEVSIEFVSLPNSQYAQLQQLVNSYLQTTQAA